MTPLADRFRRVARRAIAPVIFLGLAACIALESEPAAEDAPGAGYLGADFGNAVSHNAARQIIDPAPPNAWAGAPAMDGARAGEAIRRYRSGSVVKPETIETSTFGDLR